MDIEYNICYKYINAIFSIYCCKIDALIANGERKIIITQLLPHDNNFCCFNYNIYINIKFCKQSYNLMIIEIHLNGNVDIYCHVMRYVVVLMYVSW